MEAVEPTAPPPEALDGDRPSVPSAGGGEHGPVQFDPEAIRLQAIDAYQRVRPLYEDFAQRLRGILRQTLSGPKTKVATIEARAKSLDSLGRKASIADENDPSRPKYREPLIEITDLAGVRVITLFPETVDAVGPLIESELEVVEKTDKGDLLRQEERFGYQSVHYLVKLRPNRTALPEYARFKGLVAEIQVRTVLQHAWAEIEHDIQYLSSEAIPPGIRRRFMSLAGMLEIADREFQAIQNEDDRIRVAARKSIDLGRLGEVEIAPDALKAYLDRQLGTDSRISEFSYEFMVRVLRKLGFQNLKQLDDCIKPYDNDRVSRAIWGTRQGQVTRLEGLLLAGMGQNYIQRHQWAKQPWFVLSEERHLQRLTEAGIVVGDYVPSD